MKTSDYIADFLVKKNVKHLFGITGGAIVNVIDSIGKNPDLEFICTHHEQAAAMAADAYSRVSGNIGVGIATSGPGATNLLTGVCCAYFDSIPTLFLTGQVPRAHIKKKNSKVRQIGFQETDVINTFKNNTKESLIINEPEKIRFYLEKSFYLAKSGRPGPVLLDLPDDVQRAEIDPNSLKNYTFKNSRINLIHLEKEVEKSLELIEQAERPIVILGNGIRLGNAIYKAKEFIEKLQFPFVLTWACLDIFPNDYPLSVRDFGVTANRPGNFAVQNSDLIIALGTRLDTHETGSNLETFARQANKIVVDIDGSELGKYYDRGMEVEVPIRTDIKEFFETINPKLKEVRKKDLSDWLDKIKKWKIKYPICSKEYFNSKEQINPYVFINVLSDKAKEGDIIIPEAGCNVTWTMQGWEAKQGQRLFTSFNHSPMGYGIPASIGACFANDKKQVITIIGDGGMMMNEHELATIHKHELPVKIFVMNNEGYGMIQQTQETWLDSRYHSSTKKDFHIPNLVDIAKAHGIKKTFTIKNHNELDEKIEKVLRFDGPVFCDVKVHPNSRIYPKLSFGRPIEDLSPLLPREEFRENMIIEPLENSK
jgi:acetolactate synthase-1/2/3 large subunit